MKPTIAISMLLLMPAGLTVLRAQPAPAAAKQTVLILLRQPEGTLAKRLAELPSSTPVPEEVRAAAQCEQISLDQSQRDSFEKRMMAAGATGVVHYAALSMVRAEILRSALSSLQSDPAVVSVTPLSGDAQAVAGAEAIIPPSANLGMEVQPAAGAAIGRRGRRSDAFQSQSLSTSGIAAGRMLQPAAPAGPAGTLNPMFMPPVQMPNVQMPNLNGAMLPGQLMQGQMPPGTGPPGTGPMMSNPSMGVPGFPGPGSMFQSIMGVTGQMGMQAGTVMPRAAGMITLLSAGAQIAQILASNRKQGCTVILATAGTQIAEAGGQGVIAVNAPRSCLWQAQSDADWLQINSDGPAIGPGIVKYTATAANGVLRTGVIKIAGVAGTKVKGKASLTVRQGQ